MASVIDKINNLGKNLSSIGGTVLSALVGFDINGLGDLLETVNNQPTLACVPIQAEECSMHRQCDVGTTMLISQTSQKKDYFADNVAPRPRTWTVRGYISSLNPIVEQGLLIKPSLIMQMELLNAAAESRQSVKFKTDTGEVVDVFVQDLQIASTTKGPGVKIVSVTVQEVNVLSSAEAFLAKYNLDDVEAASVFKTAFLNLGGTNSISTGVVGTVGALLGLKI